MRLEYHRLARWPALAEAGAHRHGVPQLLRTRGRGIRVPQLIDAGGGLPWSSGSAMREAYTGAPHPPNFRLLSSVARRTSRCAGLNKEFRRVESQLSSSTTRGMMALADDRKNTATCPTRNVVRTSSPIEPWTLRAAARSVTARCSLASPRVSLAPAAASRR